MRLTRGCAREFVRGISLSLIGNNYKTQIAAEHPNTFYIVKYMQRTGNAEVTGSNPVEALIFCRFFVFFQASSFQLLKLENLLR